MRVKLDENLGRSISRLFTTAGHDVSTVAAQEMQGAADDEVFRVCVAEQRTIVTLDLDFANPFQFDPRPTAGIAVLRLPTSQAPPPTGPPRLSTLLRPTAAGTRRRGTPLRKASDSADV